MSDLFGQWVPSWITQKVLDKAGGSAWTPMILTKFPKKVRGFKGEDGLDMPSGTFVGVSVDGTNTTPPIVEENVKDLEGTDCNAWLSVEPMLGPVEFSEGFIRDYIDLVVIGARRYLRGQEPPAEENAYGTLYKQDGEWYQRPSLEDAQALEAQAWEEECRVYWKENTFPQQQPASFM
jgi:hypothetical protein